MNNGVVDSSSKQTLLCSHGTVDIDKAIASIQFRSGAETVDIYRINLAAKEGLLYLNEKGIALDGVTEAEEKQAKYKFIPIGCTDKFSTSEVCASFMKSSFGWDGVFVGTADKLIERIMKNYEERIGTITKAEKSTVKKFNARFILKGFGLKEIMENNKEAPFNGGISEDSKSKLIGLQTKLVNEQPVTQNCTAEQKVAETIPVISEVKEKPPIKVEFKFRNIYDDIYDRLLIKENWKASSKNRLSFYIKSLLEKISYEQSKTSSLKGNGYICSDNKERCIFNTGLLDIYNNDIFMIDMSNNETDFFKKDIVMAGSKASTATLGFNKVDLMNMPKPVRFYQDKQDLVFDGSIEEFDLEDNNRLYHIIQERRTRFPEAYQDMSSDVLCEKIKSAVRKAVRLSERDYKYMVPMYNLKMNKIQYLMPLHLETSIEELPELVIVVGDHNGFYCVYTILTTDDAYDNARLLCRSDSNWLRIIAE